MIEKIEKVHAEIDCVSRRIGIAVSSSCNVRGGGTPSVVEAIGIGERERDGGDKGRVGNVEVRGTRRLRTLRLRHEQLMSYRIVWACRKSSIRSEWEKGKDRLLSRSGSLLPISSDSSNDTRRLRTHSRNGQTTPSSVSCVFD